MIEEKNAASQTAADSPVIAKTGQAFLPFEDILLVEFESARNDETEPEEQAAITALRHTLDQVDWHQFISQVVAAFQEAVEKYRVLHHSGMAARVYQVSLWTDAQACVTGIDIETKEHAESYLHKWVPYWRKMGQQEWADKLETLRYNQDPADFAHQDVGQTRHPELIEAREKGRNLIEYEKIADEYTERALLRVVDRLLADGAFDRLPREKQIWIGVSSPRYWYDHVRSI